ncbi:dienelactone hydrolase family protein [Benzoatithermus flavus]|uniref:Dienelactone hydrolase family protein n=1 Tax=Benzoatithermus flavus TaxID=3108223 RepID=A0ABU8Y0Z3_9PROT
MRQEIVDLYDEFTHRGLDRRLFMARLAELTGGTAAAAAALAALRADPAKAAQVAPDDPRVAAESVIIRSDDETLKGYLARPAKAERKLPAVIVVHENRGLNPYIEDVARRLAAAGFLALAVDFLSPAGGTPTDEDKARDMIGKLDPDQVVQDAKAAIAYLRQQPNVNGKVGMVGFCWGGGIVNRTAAAGADLDAAVVFYGPVPPLDAVPAIKAPLLLHYAGLDQRINAGLPGYEDALKKAGKSYTLYVYEGVNHAFHNDTSAARYDEAAAKLAWRRTLDFFEQYLAAG